MTDQTPATPKQIEALRRHAAAEDHDHELCGVGIDALLALIDQQAAELKALRFREFNASTDAGALAAALAIVYCAATGCSLPEYSEYTEDADEVARHIAELRETIARLEAEKYALEDVISGCERCTLALTGDKEGK
jgi:hypothetical protein